MENYEARSGDEYADQLIENIIESNKNLPDFDLEFMDYWASEIRKVCNERYYMYIKGQADSYMLSEEEFIATYKEASLKLTGDVLASLVDKGQISMGVNDQGELVYAAKDWNKIKRKKKKL
jgi:hypothetical protein